MFNETPFQKRQLQFIVNDLLGCNGDEDIRNLLSFLLLRNAEGSTHIKLDSKVLREKLERYVAKMDAESAALINVDELEKSFETAIKNIHDGKYASIITVPDGIAKPLVLSGDSLFFHRLYKSKITIEKKIGEIFGDSATLNESEIQKEADKIKAELKSVYKYDLKDRQALAVAKGLQGSLIVTGGPGTGKTTVVYFILRALLMQDARDGVTRKIHLAAPSGKAKSRMAESLQKTWNDLINEDDKKANEGVYKTIAELPAKTIHHLLKAGSDGKKFAVNKDNPLEENSVVIIDEASMIDINLFAALLEALPKKVTLILLGDKNQLPSVDAGAVLGELLGKIKGRSVELNETNRFFGRLREVSDNVLNATEATSESFFEKEEFAPYTQLGEMGNKENSKVAFLTLAHGRKMGSDEANLLSAWCEKFYKETVAKAQANDCEAVFKMLEKARILCAERQSRVGVDQINEYIMKELCPKKKDFFVGEVLMLSCNMTHLDVYNGEVGVVVKGEKGLQIVFDKKDESGEYKAFSLNDFSRDALVPAYAMTIHKSQGSEFDNVLVFLPERENHPLLNKEIVYTAITRAKHTCMLVCDKQVFCKGVCVSETQDRDTGIEMYADINIHEER